MKNKKHSSAESDPADEQPPLKKIKIMEVCGTHTMAIARYGLRDFFKSAELVSGPGCPVCVTPSGRLEECVKLSKEKNVIIAAFGDMVRVPSISSSLEKEMHKGAEIKIIYSAYEPIKLALENPGKEIVFAGAGFETTAPLAASLVMEARSKKIKNFSLFSMFKSVFPAVKNLLEDGDLKIDGFLLPGNVAAVTGAQSFAFLGGEYEMPGIISGFSEKDVIDGINSVIKLARDKKSAVLNLYKSVVSDNGNQKAKDALGEVFELKDDIWRGFGKIEKSGFRLKRKYADFDADLKFAIEPVKEKKDACRCGDIMKGRINPSACKFFGKKCTPLNPLGPCMVSSEGVCSAHYKYGK